MKDLLTVCAKACEHNEKIAVLTESRFNIFSILGMETDEKYAHTKLIAELLDPKGGHMMGDVFLRLFMQQLGLPYAKEDHYAVFSEYYAGRKKMNWQDEYTGGNIDVIVFSNDKAIIVIENKINAREQDDQLLRYRNTFKDAELYFLTLDGYVSESEKISDSQYKRISYRKDMIAWIDSCIRESSLRPFVRETLKQYNNLLKKITNQNINTSMNDEIMQTILSDKNRYDAYVTLCNIKQDLEAKMLESLHASLKKVADKRKCGFIDDDFPRESYNKFWFAYKNASMDEYGLAVCFEFEGYNMTQLCFGFYWYDESKKNDDLADALYRAFEIEYADTKVSSNKTWPCWVAWNGWSGFAQIAGGSYFSHEFSEAVSNKLKELQDIFDTVVSEKK